MISITSSTSITSISGVVLISISTSGSSEPPALATFIPMELSCSVQPPSGGGSVMKATLVMPARWHASSTLPTPS